jgi:hypothetical protein
MFRRLANCEQTAEFIEADLQNSNASGTALPD